MDHRFDRDDPRHNNTPAANRLMHEITPGAVLFCCRCGRHLPCTHINCDATEDADRAVRIRARYALGREHNPDHDTTDYFTDP